MEHQEHFGKRFYLDGKRGYWISTTKPRIRAHVWVWQCVNGKRPKNCHIHHKDGNKSNNLIENLELVKSAKHLRDHMTPERRIMAAENAKKWQHRTKEWHKSVKGLEWHKKHGIVCWEQRASFSSNCKECGKNFITKTYHQLFCSNNCKSISRRKSGVDDVDVICAFCKKVFKRNRYAKKKYCGIKCSHEATRGKGKIDS